MAKKSATVRISKELAAEYVERDALIKLLGMAPEDRSTSDSRYAATTGEFRCWARKDGLLAA